jgi:hypothetical protein
VDRHSCSEALSRFRGKPPALRGLPSETCDHAPVIPQVSVGYIRMTEFPQNNPTIGLLRQPAGLWSHEAMGRVRAMNGSRGGMPLKFQACCSLMTR